MIAVPGYDVVYVMGGHVVAGFVDGPGVFVDGSEEVLQLELVGCEPLVPLKVNSTLTSIPLFYHPSQDQLSVLAAKESD